MNTFKKIALLSASLIGTAAAFAIPSYDGIVGDIHIVADDYVEVDFVNDNVTFIDEDLNGYNSVVSYANGDYAALDGAGANYSDFSYAPFVEGIIWSVDADTYFILKKIDIIEEIVFGSYKGLFLAGTGLGFHDGLTQDGSIGSWTFSTDVTNGTSFSFSSTTAVPDSGATIAMLGLALVGIGAVSRRKK